MAVIWPFYGRFMAVLWPFYGRCMAVLWQNAQVIVHRSEFIQYCYVLYTGPSQIPYITYPWQKFIVGNMLSNSRHDVSTFLVKNLIIPMGVHSLKQKIKIQYRTSLENTVVKNDTSVTHLKSLEHNLFKNVSKGSVCL